MNQRGRRRDVNEAEIVEALRRAGCTVEQLDAARPGLPDLLVGRAGVNYLIEVKRRGFVDLADVQVDWHLRWRGQVSTVSDPQEALAVVGLGQLWDHDRDRDRLANEQVRRAVSLGRKPRKTVVRSTKEARGDG